jgi:DNA-binding CsgD family transcriptional regulator
MPARLSSRVLVGRVAELTELDAAYERAAGGTAAGAAVGGEAGVGKSRLLGELTSRSRDAGAQVLAGACVDLHDAAMPLLPIADALAPLGPLPAGAPADLAEVGRGVAPGVAVFAPVLELLREACAASPVVLALDDIHWADRSTLDLLAFLVARLRDERLLLVVTFRSDELERRDALRGFLADAGRRPAMMRLELRRLTRDEVSSQLEGILDRAPDPALAEAVFARSAGNPLFAEELVAAAGRDDAGGMPETLRDILLARIGALDAGAQDVVRAAAVGGGRIHHSLLASAVALEEPSLTDAIRETVRHHVLVADDSSLVFRHPLLQEAAYGELMPGERARLHAACAAMLERAPELAGGSAATVAAEIAHHWWQAGEQPQALTAAVRAGLAAEGIPAPAEAADHFSRALELWDAVEDAEQRSGIERVELLARAAEAMAWTGDSARAVELVGAALTLVDEIDDPAGAGVLHERRGWYMWWLNRPEDGLADYEHAVRLIPPEPATFERAQAVAGLGFMLEVVGRPAEARDRCEEAVAAARAAGARAPEARALAILGMKMAFVGGDVPAGIELIRHARALARECGDPDVAAQASAGLSDVLRRDGQLEEAVSLGLEAAEECRRSGLDLAHGSVNALNAAEAALELGRWELTERVARDVLAGQGTPITHGFAHHLLAALAILRGDFAAARESLDAEIQSLGADPGPEPVCYALETRAELALAEHRFADASRDAKEARDRATTFDDAPYVARMGAVVVRAEAARAELAHARRDASAARSASDRARSTLDQVRGGMVDHPALLAAMEAEVARAEGGSDPELWHAAAIAWDARGCPHPAAYARWRLAEALLAAPGGRGSAAAALREAWTTAERLGALPLMDEIEALARRARIDLIAEGEQAPRVDGAVPDAARELGLTVRELEVLEHVALGQTNREIAADLFISPRTAGVHVAHILEKLGAATRTEAAAAAHRLGLVS